MRRGPLGGAPVKGLARVEQVVECAHRLLDRSHGVRPVRVDHVDVREVEAREAGRGALDDVLAREELGVDARAGARRGAEKELRRDDKVLAAPDLLVDAALDRRAHDALGRAARVRLGVVEEVDAARESRLHESVGVVLAHLEGEGHPASEGEARDDEPAAAQRLHRHRRRRGGGAVGADGGGGGGGGGHGGARQQQEERQEEGRGRQRDLSCGEVLGWVTWVRNSDRHRQ